ncbi:amidohydrolase family protein [Paraburkholderia sp. RL17-337-BIB-A]|uniref:amidohydrolase family protein n=1 Tax=Paraburkholderia sp. RL17-337-BIB-A TaxID=3031636 RepID=UPI0038B92F8B
MMTDLPSSWTYAAPAFDVPAGTCDSHAHVIAPDGSGLIAQRRYTPAPAPEEEYFRMLDSLRIHRGVLVQPSVYGTDNSYLLATLRRNPKRLRGVAVLHAAVAGSTQGPAHHHATDETLADMHAAGVRGVRINALFGGGASLSNIDALARCIAPLGWHLQLYVDGQTLLALRTTLEALPCAVVFDHMGHVETGEGTDGKAFQALLALVRDHGHWVKLSGANRVTRNGTTHFDEIVPLAKTLADAAPERVLWGSDWPHVGLATWHDTGELFNLVPRWLPDPAARRLLLVDNPARLYGFESDVSDGASSDASAGSPID